MKKLIPFLICFLLGVSTAKAQWVAQTVPPNSGGIKEINIINSNVVWALGSGTGPLYPGSVLRTTDGGTTWATVPVNIPGLSGQFMIYSFHALDANTVYLTGQVYNPGTNGVTRIYKTTDAGLTWLPIPGVYSLNTSFASFVYFFDQNNGLIFGDNQEIYTTNNGGNSWSQVPAVNLPPNAGNLDAALNFKAVAGDTIWVPVQGMRIYKSTDKGLTWTLSLPNIPTPIFLDGIAFQNGNNGLANLANSLVRTTNGGQTWTPVNFKGPFLSKGLTAIPGLPNTYISYRSISNYSGMSITRDNGLTWTQLDSTVYYSAAFQSSMVAWSGGNNIIYKLNSNISGAPEPLPAAANNFTIAPNPSTGIFTVSASPVQNYAVEVYNILGNKVFQQQSAPFTPTKIDITTQPKGVYFVRFLSKGQIFTRKIILN